MCDGADNDCDGLTDEEDPAAGLRCDTGEAGACAAGTRVCHDGELVCRAERRPAVEVCDGADNDCDGLTDEDAGGEPLTEICYDGAAGTEGVGPCHAGVRTCDQGVFGPCVGQVVPGTEQCNGRDDDCNGAVDDLGAGACVCLPGERRDCYSGPDHTEGVGPCTGGTQVCLDDGSGFGPCDGEVTPAAEICDGEDNDCNGVEDDAPGVGDHCSAGEGSCRSKGRLVCNAATGRLECDARPGEPADEICDRLDNDCDGEVDDVDGLGEPCNSGVGICRREGVTVCDLDARTVVCSAVPGVPAAAEICNGEDDDCDGETDDVEGLGSGCEVGVGACRREGVTRCDIDARLLVCSAVAGEPAEAEICNGEDDDCDGTPDEAVVDVGDACQVGVGACRRDAVTVCRDGVRVCAGEPGVAAEEVCDEVDNDCDGEVDEGEACLCPESYRHDGQECVCDPGALPFSMTMRLSATNAQPNMLQGGAVADLDGDGDRDLVVASFDFDMNGITWRPNEGGGRFGPPRAVTDDANGHRAERADVGDIDGDGDLDIVVSRSRTLLAFTNDGAGNFDGPLALGEGDLDQVKLVDFDQDGDLDALIGEISGSWLDGKTVSFLRNDGAAPWTEARRWFVARGTRDYTSADVDGDGSMDLLVVSQDRGLHLYRGGLAISEMLADRFSLSSVDVADLDGDGFLDILVSGKRTAGWLRNDGNGGFDELELLYEPFLGANGIRASDLDENGDPDAVLVTHRALVTLMNQDGTFVFGGEVEGVMAMSEVRVEDVDGRPGPDVVLFANSAGPRWYANDGRGRFSPASLRPARGGEHGRGLVMADIDGDGVTDILTVTADALYWHKGPYNTHRGKLATDLGSVVDVAVSNLYDDGAVHLLISRLDPAGNGRLDRYTVGRVAYQIALQGPFAITEELADPRAVIVGDVDGDERPDIVHAVAGDDTVAWYRNAGPGAIEPARTATDVLRGPRDLALTDLEDDGDPDLLVAAFEDDTVAWLPNDGEGGFGRPQVLSAEIDGASALASGDLDGDDRPDVVAAGSVGGTVHWFRSEGPSVFEPPRLIADGLTDPDVLTVGDLDGDGDADVAVGSRSADRISWFANDGSAQFTEVVDAFPMFGGASALVLHDNDGDGNLDLLAQSLADGSVAAFTPARGFEALRPLPGSPNTLEDAELVDIDADGDVDIVSAANRSILFHRNEGHGEFGEPVTLAEGLEGASTLATGDIDGDGRLDVAFAAWVEPRIAWVPGVPDGFGPARDFVVDFELNGPTLATLADVDGDGDLDFLFRARRPERVVWLENAGGGQMGETRFAIEGLDFIARLEVADLDADGDLDIVLFDLGERSLKWYANDGGGVFVFRATLDADSRVTTLVPIDFDGDGDLDVVSDHLSEGLSVWYPNDGDGNFGERQVIVLPGQRPGTVSAVTDLDQDGHVDILTASGLPSFTTWFRGDGTGRFVPSVIDDHLPTPRLIRVGDLDGDGHRDVLIDNRSMDGWIRAHPECRPVPH